MKKTIGSLITTCLIYASIILSLSACSKNENNYASSTQENEIVSAISEKIVSDETFIFFTKTFIEESYKIKNNKNDSSIIIIAADNIQKALANFLVSSPDFLAQTPDTRKAILENIRVLLTNEKYKATYANEFKQLITFNARTNSGITTGSDYKTMESELETDEILGCALQAILNMLSSYGGTIDKVIKLKNLNFGSSELVKLALEIIKKDSPWYVVASISLQVGTCLISEIND